MSTAKQRLTRDSDRSSGDRLDRRLSGLGLPPEVVVRDQRRRIATALCLAVFRQGYGETRVLDVIERAGVSRRTFYDLYRNKADAFRAVYRETLDQLDRVVRGACRSKRDWSSQVSVAVFAALEWAAVEPARAHILVGEPISSGPDPGYGYELLAGRFAPHLRRGRDLAPHKLAPRLEELILGGLAFIVAARLRTGRAAELPALAPRLAELVLAPYRE